MFTRDTEAFETVMTSAQQALEEELDQRIDEAKESVHECLTDNLNTSGAIEALLKLVAATNKYMKQREVDLATVPPGKLVRELLEASAFALPAIGGETSLARISLLPQCSKCLQAQLHIHTYCENQQDL